MSLGDKSDDSLVNLVVQKDNRKYQECQYKNIFSKKFFSKAKPRRIIKGLQRLIQTPKFPKTLFKPLLNKNKIIILKRGLYERHKESYPYQFNDVGYLEFYNYDLSRTIDASKGKLRESDNVLSEIISELNEKIRKQNK